MKEGVKRITTGFLFMLVIVLVLALNNKVIDSIFVTLLSIAGIYEYNKCFKRKGYHPISFIGYLIRTLCSSFINILFPIF